MSKVSMRTIPGTQTPFTFGEYMATSKASLAADLNELLTNDAFAIPGTFESTYRNEDKEVDQKAAADIISGRMLQMIQSQPQNITVIMLNRVEATLSAYGMDFKWIRYTYDTKLDKMVDNVFNKKGYTLPKAVDQIEFNGVLTGKISEYVKTNTIKVTKTKIENLMNFIWQLDDCNSFNLIRGICLRTQQNHSEFKQGIWRSPQWLQWRKTFKYIILDNSQPLRATKRFSNKEENIRSMESFKGITINI